MSQQEILKDHKRIGKRFVPPLMQLGIQEVSYVNKLLPEIIWMGLIFDCINYRAGIGFCEKITKLAHEIYASEKYANFALCSSFSRLENRQKEELVRRLNDQKLLEPIQLDLAPLIVLYDNFPMSFLGVTQNKIEKEILIRRIKEAIRRYMNKYEKPGLVLQATTIYMRGITGGLFLNKDIEPPDLNSIIDNPESEPAKKAGAFVRSSVLMEIMSPESESLTKWADPFWDQGLQVDTCEFGDIVNE
jgi:hypothetical protein